MGQLVFQATLGGQVNLVGPNTASTFNLNVPAVAGNLITSGDSATVTNTMLAGSIANAKLLNSSVTVGSTSIALGASATTVTGLTLTSPTLTTPVLGTPSSGTLTNCTGLPTSGLTGTISEANGGTGTTTGYYGFKNRIINGAMVISQRGTSFTSSGGNQYTLDRFFEYGSVASKFTVAQSSTAPSGFINSLLVTSSAATSVGSSDQYRIEQDIEGLNCADLAWGTANAKTVTLSFWVQSSLTGTFGGSLRNGAADRSYPFSYTISSANTFEYKTITVVGDQSGTWLTTNGNGMRVCFGLGVGSALSGTAGTWAGANYASATGATSVVGTNGATFYITGVQLEKGSTATSFDYRPYSAELAMCQRYYEMFGDGCPLSLQVSTSYQLSARFIVEKRATPTFLHVINYGVTCAGNGQTITSLLSTNTATTKGCVLNVVPNNFIGVVAGQAAYVSSSYDGISASSEL